MSEGAPRRDGASSAVGSSEPSDPNDQALAETQAGGALEAIAEITGRDAPRPSRRGGARDDARAHVYASVTGEGTLGDVAAHAPIVEEPEASRYEPGPLLGQGGMGEVVLTLDHRIGRHVARKTLLGEVASARSTSLFVREVRVQGQLEHPSVVPVYDFGVGPNGAPYFTMKRVRGETLAHILERLGARDPDYVGRFSRHKLLAAFRQVCLAVEYAHTRGVAHRDLKPSNVMLGDFGEVYLLDWGLAKLRSDASVTSRGGVPDDRPSGPLDAERTSADELVGTPAYMAPEQFRRSGQAFDPRLDVFALGAILYEILTLSRFRPGATFATLIQTLIRESDRPVPERPSDLAPDVPPELDDVCVRALAADPARRLASALTIAEVIERHLEGDRDLEARRVLAESLLTSARGRIAKGGHEASVRVEAMREAIKALALTPDDVETQRFLLSLVVDGSGVLPPEAEREFEADDFELDAHALRMSMLGLSSWFLTLPLAMWIGIRQWLPVGVMITLTLTTIAYIGLVIRWRSRATRHMLTMAALLATTLAMSACWLGPFVLAPVATTAIAMLFASRCKPSERVPLILLWAFAVFAPFGVELLHLAPPAYTFKGDDLILHARALAIPEGLTTAALIYTSVTFLVLPMLFVGQLRDKQRSGDRKLFIQAWHLRQLFPAATANVSANVSGRAPPRP